MLRPQSLPVLFLACAELARRSQAADGWPVGPKTSKRLTRRGSGDYRRARAKNGGGVCDEWTIIDMTYLILGHGLKTGD